MEKPLYQHCGNEMFRSVLTLALVATQLLTWSGGSFYLCVGRDGSVQLDRSPSSCRRCAQKRDCDDDRDHDHSCSSCSCCKNCRQEPEEDRDSRCGFRVLHSHPCGCTHVLITQSSLPTTQNRSSFAAASELVQPLDTFAVLACSMAWDVSWVRFRTSADLDSHDSSFRSAMLRSTVIRC